MFRLLRRSTICFLLLVIWYGQGRATLVPRMSLDEMVDLSACVVEAKVGRSWPAWDPAHQFIWTHYELEVRDWLKALPYPDDTKRIGEDIKTVEFGWPVGMPVCRPLGKGIYNG